MFFYLFFFVAEKKKYGTYVLLRPENYFTDEIGVHHQKLKCAINDALIGSQ